MSEYKPFNDEEIKQMLAEFNYHKSTYSELYSEEFTIKMRLIVTIEQLQAERDKYKEALKKILHTTKCSDEQTILFQNMNCIYGVASQALGK